MSLYQNTQKCIAQTPAERIKTILEVIWVRFKNLAKHRLSFSVPPELFSLAHEVPWGIRAALLRILLLKVLEAGGKHGKMVYGAVLEGEWDIVPRSK